MISVCTPSHRPTYLADLAEAWASLRRQTPARRAARILDGWRFAEAEVDGVRHTYPLSREPSAAALSTIHHAPNHLRAWRRSVYEDVGGHNADLDVLDDHELLIRTYLHARMVRIPRLLYLQRVHGANTWVANQSRIAEGTAALGVLYGPVLRRRGASL